MYYPCSKNKGADQLCGHPMNFNCFFRHFNCVNTQIRSLIRVLTPSISLSLHRLLVCTNIILFCIASQTQNNNSFTLKLSMWFSPLEYHNSISNNIKSHGQGCGIILLLSSFLFFFLLLSNCHFCMDVAICYSGHDLENVSLQ